MTHLAIFLLVLAFYLPTISIAAEGITHLPKGECTTCHTDYREIPSGEKCMRCHRDTGQRFIQLAQAQMQTAKPLRPQVSGQGPGMSVPIYYERTRIGAQPNEMILIPAGDFIMGTNERLSDEGPQHKVNVKAFLIDKYEVTNLQYRHFIETTGRRAPEHFLNRTYPEGKVDHPVTYVSWRDAKAYCEWADKRLPTDEEWEKAARGTDGRTFPWGNTFDINKSNSPVRWSQLNLEGDTTPVGSFDAGVSPYGLYDVSGNVWEWTDNWYKAYPGNTQQNENYGEKYKTLKGGSWWDCSFYKCGISAPVFNRSFFNIRVKNSSFGFRCAKDAK